MRGIITLAALALSATVAHANTWTGCKIGGVAGLTAATTAASVTSPFLAGASASLDGLGTDGADFGGIVGCDYQFGSIVVGAFADYVFRDQEWSIGATDGVDSLKISTPFGDQWSIGGRLGYTATPTTLVYVLAAYTEAKGGSIGLAVNGAPVGSVDLGDFKGYSLGGGVETFLAKNVVASLEGRWTRFDSRTLDLGFAAADLETDTLSVRAGLAIRFGADTANLLPTR